MHSILFIPLAFILTGTFAFRMERSSCDFSNATLGLPENQTALTVPTSAPHFMGLGVGFQNYTCNATTQTYSSIGAVSDLADVSCLLPSYYPLTSQYLYDIWKLPIQNESPRSIFSRLGADILGRHYFVANPLTNNGTTARWDFSGDICHGNYSAFVDATPVASLPAPTKKDDADWVRLRRQSGDLASEVYRVHTRGGKPPAICDPKDTKVLQVKYTAFYAFYGGSVKCQRCRRNNRLSTAS